MCILNKNKTKSQQHKREILKFHLTDVPGIRYGKDKFVTDRVSIVIYRAILLILSGIFSHNPGR